MQSGRWILRSRDINNLTTEYIRCAFHFSASKAASAYFYHQKFTLDMLRDSRFCLCPSGWGWGWRLSLAVVTQCVP